MEFVIELGISVVFGAIVAAVAHGRGRSVVGWFVLGTLFSCFALLLVLVLPDLKLEEERRDRLRRENQRLREQLRKDRQVADQRHAEVSGRLGAHDAVMGIDTRTDGGGAENVAARIEDSGDSIDPESRWHYALSDESGTHGPIAFIDLKDLWKSGELSRSSLLWTSGMDDWLAVAELPHVHEELRRA